MLDYRRVSMFGFLFRRAEFKAMALPLNHQSSFLGPIRILALLAIAAILSGCQVLGAIAGAGAGPSTVDAQYKPPQEPTLVLVENYSIASGGDVEGDRLGRYISEELTTNKVVPLVDYARLTQLRDQDHDAYRKMSVAQIGRAVGAKQVIYVNVGEYGPQTPGNGDLVNWKGSVKVKVVDATTGGSPWPSDQAAGEPVVAETHYKELDPEKGDVPVQEELNKMLGEKIGRFFHSWQKDRDGPEDYQQ